MLMLQNSFLHTKIVKNHATVDASTRSSRSNSPENGGEALQESQHNDCRQSRVSGPESRRGRVETGSCCRMSSPNWFTHRSSLSDFASWETDPAFPLPPFNGLAPFLPFNGFDVSSTMQKRHPCSQHVQGKQRACARKTPDECTKLMYTDRTADHSL